jgi:hypothetical protein
VSETIDFPGRAVNAGEYYIARMQTALAPRFRIAANRAGELERPLEA